jgi:ABC-type Fe3+ transport system permease subunit
LLPFWTSLLVRTYAWMVLLGRNGVVNRFLLETGVISQPLPLLYNKYGCADRHGARAAAIHGVSRSTSIMRRVDSGLLLAAEGSARHRGRSSSGSTCR